MPYNKMNSCFKDWWCSNNLIHIFNQWICKIWIYNNNLHQHSWFLFYDPAQQTTAALPSTFAPAQQQRPAVGSLPELPPIVAPVQQVAAQGEAVQPAPNFIQSAPPQPSVSVPTQPPAKNQRLELQLFF